MPISGAALAEPAAPPNFAELATASFKIGCLGFGGPAGQIALMHRIFVEEKKWIGEARYLHALNYCMLLPGPEAQQLATYAGWLLHGVKGGIVAGALFVLPGALVVLGLSWLYAAHAQSAFVSAVFYGVKAAVLAFIIDALIRIGRRALKSRADVAIAAAAFGGLYLFGIPFPLIILAAAISGLWLPANPAPSMPPLGESSSGSSVAGALKAAALWGALWLAPVALLFMVAGPDHVLTEVGMLFSRLAVVTFGGAYAVLAYLQQQAVDVHGWLTTQQMIDGLGLAETTPGPLILVNQFVGFLAGWQAQGGGPLMALAATAIAGWCTFAPSYVWIFAGAPFAERLRRNRFAAGALRAITASVLGVVASLALWFGQHVLFRDDVAFSIPWGRPFSVPVLTSLDPASAAIAGAAAMALARYKVNAALVVVLCAAVGLVRSTFN